MKFDCPFDRLVRIAKIYSIPTKTYIQFHPELSADGKPPFGETIEKEGGKEFVINISANLPVMVAVEIMAHELAHVIVGLDEGHNKKWDKMFSKLQKDFYRSQIEDLKKLGHIPVPQPQTAPNTRMKQ